MWNTLNLKENNFKEECNMHLGKKLEKTCIVFSNEAPAHNYVSGTLKSHKCSEKINGYGKVLQFFSAFTFYNLFIQNFCWK